MKKILIKSMVAGKTHILALWLVIAMAIPCALKAANDSGLLDAPNLASEPIQPIPLNVSHDKDKVHLGEKLFFDNRLSVDGKFSCTSCHDLRNGGIDNLPNPEVRHGEIKRNVLTLFNSRFNLAQVWDGRFKNIEQDTDATVTNPQIFNSTWPVVIDRLTKHKNYNEQFNKIYPDGVTQENVVDAIAEFVRSLITINAPFDRYLRGEKSAISHRAKLGYHHFKEYGCSACHNGVNVGGNMFQRIGVTRDYFEDRIGIIEPDVGRMKVTGKEDDLYEFKVPSLRLVTRTAPYFHDGSVAKLDEAIRIMGKYQLGREIPDEHIRLIIDFLGTLRGSYRGYQP